MSLIETTLGMMESDELVRTDGVAEDDEWRRVSWTEHHHEGELVRRDVHVEIKKFPPIFADASLG